MSGPIRVASWHYHQPAAAQQLIWLQLQLKGGEDDNEDARVPPEELKHVHTNTRQHTRARMDIKHGQIEKEVVPDRVLICQHCLTAADNR